VSRVPRRRLSCIKDRSADSPRDSFVEDDDDDDTRVLRVTMGNNVNVPKHFTDFGFSYSPIISHLSAPGSGAWSGE
jgi:hypothetical protein